MITRVLPLLVLALPAAFASAANPIERIVTANSAAGDAYTAPTNSFIPITSTPGFGYNNIRANSVAGIDGTLPRSGNGSAFLSLQDGVGKADVEYYNLTATGGFSGLGLLKDLTTFNYDFLKQGSSADNAFAVAARLMVDLDGDFTTAGDRGLVIYEPIYTQQAAGNTNYVAPEDAWTTESTSQTQGRFWIRFAGQNQYNVNGMTLGALTDPSTTGMITPLNNGTATVYGFNAGIGSGYSGAFSGAVDNITLGFNGSAGTRFNFETSAVPEPATMAALGLGAFGLLKRRRKAAK